MGWFQGQPISYSHIQRIPLLTVDSQPRQRFRTMIGLSHCAAAFVIGSPNYIGELFPLATSGIRYRTLNVTIDASNIDTKKKIRCLVCLSIDELLSSRRYLFRIIYAQKSISESSLFARKNVILVSIRFITKLKKRCRMNLSAPPLIFWNQFVRTV